MQLDTLKKDISENRDAYLLGLIGGVIGIAIFTKVMSNRPVIVKQEKPNWFIRWIEYRRELKLAKLRTA